MAGKRKMCLSESKPLYLMDATWRAELSLDFARRGERSVLARRRHHGPLLVQKSLYPEGEGVCHAVLLHPPGGVAGGDQLEIRIAAEPGARALMTTPGATRWYKRGARGASRQRLVARVEADAALEWLPQENIVFDAADAALETRLELAQNAKAIGWEIVCLGRAASGEQPTQARIFQQTDLWLDKKLVWREQGELYGSSPLMQAAAGLGGKRVYGTLWLAGIAPCRELLAALRGVSFKGVECAATALPQVTLVRALSDSSEGLRNAFIRCWQIARPAMLGCAAVLPRIWAT